MTTITGIDSSILLSYMQSKAGITVDSSGASTSYGAGATATVQQPTAPWQSGTSAPQESDLLKSAMSGGKLIDENAAKLDVSGASQDYKKLFALYQGLNSLKALVDRYSADGVTNAEKTQIEKTFASGLGEVSTYAEGLKLDNLRLTRGAAIDMLPSQLTTTTAFGKFDTDVGMPVDSNVYTTGTVYTGSRDAAVPAFEGDNVKFNITVKKVNSTVDAPIDLSGMGSTPRTMGNVTNYINAQLKAAGSVTRFSVVETPGTPQTTTVGGKTVTLSTPPSSWAFKVTSDIGEKVSFSAPDTAAAVYIGQTAGRPDDPKTTDVNENDQEQQFLKFQTDQNQTAQAPPATTAVQGASFYVDGRAFANPLQGAIFSIRQTVTGADGSVYMLANVDGTVSGQSIKGTQDVALMKYDSAGALIYSRTLGAAGSASGMALAVSNDGKVAIAGSVTGSLGGDSGVDASLSDSFVSLYDANGDEMWTQRRASRLDDTATAVAFGADGNTVYVAGNAKGNMPGAPAVGGQDGYLESFTGTRQPLTGTYKVATNFVTQFGTTGTDSVSGMTLQGNSLVTAGVENGHAVLRSFDLSGGGTPTLSAARDLGDLMGGSLAGVSFNGSSVVVAGTTRNAALSAGTVTTAASGGTDGFVASLSADLTASAGDTLSYFGGSGNDTVSAMTVSGGQVWITGAAGKGDLPGGQAPVGTQDGYAASIDPATGAVTWSRRFTAKDGQAAPTSIAVAASGASVLDAFGLPQGAMQHANSQLITSNTSARAGDYFEIRTEEGATPAKVTLDANDTLDTLKTKIQRATGFQATVQIVTDGNVQRLQIKPLNANSTVEVLGGSLDQNALEALGIPEGVVSVKPDTSASSTPNKNQVYGLTLSRSLDLSTADGLKTATDELTIALATVRNAYRGLDAIFNPTTATTNSVNPSGTVPTYLTNEISNYQAALDRLTGGSTSNTTSYAGLLS